MGLVRERLLSPFTRALSAQMEEEKDFIYATECEMKCCYVCAIKPHTALGCEQQTLLNKV